LYGGIAEVTQDTTNSTTDDDKTEEVLGFTYAMNNWTFGYQWSEVDLGKSSGATKYDNAGYGITFNVNDDLSIGYNYYESEQSNTTNNKLEATSLQVAYTMGGASIRLAEAEVDNASYSTAAGNDIKATTLSVSLAF
jgi:hypothetical protein